MRVRSVVIACLLGAQLVMGCSSQEGTSTSGGAASQPLFPEFDEAGLKQGREVWMETCKGCHAYGFAGSPKAGDKDAWSARIAKGKDVLYRHATEGFFGPGGTMMPPRGGNESLTDEQVRLAVDYMIALVER